MASAPQAPENGHNERRGPVETKVRHDVAALISAHPMGEALAEMAYTLSRTLDKGAGLAVAAVNRELQVTLAYREIGMQQAVAEIPGIGAPADAGRGKKDDWRVRSIR